MADEEELEVEAPGRRAADLFAWCDTLRSDLTRFLMNPSPSIGEVDAELLADQALARVTRLRPDLLGTGEGRAVVFTTARKPAAGSALRLERMPAGSAAGSRVSSGPDEFGAGNEWPLALRQKLAPAWRARDGAKACA